MPNDAVDHENREALDMIAALYQIEDEAERSGITGTPAHLELRQRKSRRIVEKLWRWVDARDGKHSPKSKMGKAIGYATKQRERLEHFLHDPKLVLDNNCAERALRITALGRKNSLFAGSTPWSSAKCDCVNSRNEHVFGALYRPARSHALLLFAARVAPRRARTGLPGGGLLPR